MFELGLSIKCDIDDPRFREYGIAPKTKAEDSFLSHCLYHTKESGRVAITLPQGVLFRGAAEGRIPKALIDKHQIESVIGFPDKLFLNTGIPVCVLILKKNRANSDILFVDASQGFEKMKNQKQLRPEDIYKITETVIHRKAVDKYSHLAMLEEVIENDYNLNIPRYVDTFEEEEPIDLSDIQGQIDEVDAEIAKANQTLANPLLKELGSAKIEGKGLKAPELRFDGFTDDWEERKLGEITTSYSGGTPSAGNSSYYKGDIPFIRSGEINSSKTELLFDGRRV